MPGGDMLLAMAKLSALCDLLDAFAPPCLAEDWDNTGLLMGDRSMEVGRVMTCLTLTPDSAAEAVDERADLVVTHHPLPFRPLAKITTDTVEGGMLWRLARAGVAVYSPHTAFDSAASGINAALANALKLRSAAPLNPTEDEPAVGAGRIGLLPTAATLEEVAARIREFTAAESVRVVGPVGKSIASAAVACGSGGSFIASAATAGADVLITGEATFHNCLAAQAAGLALVLPGHYASERFAVERLAEWLAKEAAGLAVWPSIRERDPLRTL
ncbi:putative GTP cyclohydrolase 1 type 2 [Posidoniimonas corsicana]|uniref:GTP cyclohydrolase 1 type 2 homolog n=2 Tax=Posidoniimonas corsicana TaxID=1938618 RepID=A0A5C5VHD6_9BACT|nr:putative GTP cyclohydrolase 1 type 2 [Posidoniimonas corsicana]